jgi:hypothetical protein
VKNAIRPISPPRAVERGQCGLSSNNNCYHASLGGVLLSTPQPRGRALAEAGRPVLRLGSYPVFSFRPCGKVADVRVGAIPYLDRDEPAVSLSVFGFKLRKRLVHFDDYAKRASAIQSAEAVVFSRCRDCRWGDDRYTARMEAPKISVYFICHHCERLYLTSQARSRSPGHFDCTDCGKPVHEWFGHYEFTNWQRVGSGTGIIQ